MRLFLRQFFMIPTRVLGRQEVNAVTCVIQIWQAAPLCDGDFVSVATLCTLLFSHTSLCKYLESLACTIF